MTWRDELADQLSAALPCGYERHGAPATEPTCLAAIALAAWGRKCEMTPAFDWLAANQNKDGSVGPTAKLASPGWPTALAVFANGYASGSGGNDVLGIDGEPSPSRRDEASLQSAFDVNRGVRWLLDAKGDVLARTATMGHDSTLVGWPWVLGTHSWIEPTALAVLALKSAGQGEHERTREAVRLLRDRLLENGGCNYGNTTVLGQTLRPHLQPTGLALLALHGEEDSDGRIARSLDYLQSELNVETPTASLCYAVLALRRHGRELPQAAGWLDGAARRTIARDGSPYRLALLLLAAMAQKTEA
jgi:hypothetical protein